MYNHVHKEISALEMEPIYSILFDHLVITCVCVCVCVCVKVT